MQDWLEHELVEIQLETIVATVAIWQMLDGRAHLPFAIKRDPRRPLPIHHYQFFFCVDEEPVDLACHIQFRLACRLILIAGLFCPFGSAGPFSHLLPAFSRNLLTSQTVVYHPAHSVCPTQFAHPAPPAFLAYVAKLANKSCPALIWPSPQECNLQRDWD